MSEFKELQDANFVVIGGGTGAPRILRAARELSDNITAVVNGSDDGGSTGRLRKLLGVFPPGDVMRCIAALSRNPELAERFLGERFSDDAGELSGHSTGNLALANRAASTGNFEQAVDELSILLGVVGQVPSVTLQDHTLVMRDGGEEIWGESKIDEHTISSPNPHVRHEPPVWINPRAEAAIDEADVILVAPGNIYSSLVPALAVGGLREAIQRSKAIKIMMANFFTKPGHQAPGTHVADTLRLLERYIGKDQFDYLVYNNQPPSPELMRKYAAEDEYLLGIEEDGFGQIRARKIGASLVANEVVLQNPNDSSGIRRTYIRHGIAEVAAALEKIYNEHHSGTYDTQSPEETLQPASA